MVEYDPKNQTEEYVTAVPVTVPIRVPQVPVPQLDISDDMIKTYNYRPVSYTHLRAHET